MNARLTTVLAVVLLAANADVMCAGAVSPASPDFSGWWSPVNPFARETGDLIQKLRPENAARYKAALESGRRPAEDYGYCTPPSFSGGPPPADPHGYFELLISPGRLTLLDGQGLIRRLYVRDAPIPDALEESRSGTSIARWEGSTLVVQTTGMYRKARPEMAVVLGRNASAVERYSLKDADTLEVVTTLNAPDLLIAPAVRTKLYRRSGSPPLDLDNCREDDASVDPASGRERFDTTPPDDLPPPPAG